MEVVGCIQRAGRKLRSDEMGRAVRVTEQMVDEVR